MSKIMNPVLSFLLSATIVVCPPPLRAAGEYGEIVVSVVDLRAKRPMTNARVILSGADAASALSDSSGLVRYRDVRPGTYRIRVGHSGFREILTAFFVVDADRIVTVDAVLARSDLAIIGSVSTKTRVSVSTSIEPNGPVRRISDSLEDALDKVAGVSLTENASTSNGATSVSLHNHDGAQTGASIDGVPLAVPGMGTNLRSLGTDLFSGAQVDFGPTPGSLGGTVNFQTLQPTDEWQARLASALGTFDHALVQASTSGRLGKLGIVFQHSVRSQNSPLTFSNFEDQSGLSYPHGGESKMLAELLKLQLPVNERLTLSALGIASNGTSAPLCRDFATILPCGIGPGNTNASHESFGYLRAQYATGSVGWSLTTSTMSQAEVGNDENRQLAGLRYPSSYEWRDVTKAYNLTGSVMNGRHAVTFIASSVGSKSRSTAIDGLPQSLAQTAAARQDNAAEASTQYRLLDSFTANEHLQVRAGLSLAEATGVLPVVLGAVGATWRPNRSETYDIALDVGSAQPVLPFASVLSNPADARFNCTASIAQVVAGTDPATPQNSKTIRGAWTKSGAAGYIKVAAYLQVQTGQPFNASIDALDAGTGVLSPSYLSSLNAIRRLPTVCGSAPDLRPQDVYVDQYVTNTTRRYQGIDLTAKLSLGTDVSIFPTYSLNQATLSAADARLTGPYSLYRLGDQLPGAPLHRIGLTATADPSNWDGTELIANMEWVSNGNFRHLEAYNSLNAGISRRIGAARLTLFGTNLLNEHAGTLTTFSGAQSEARTSGGPLRVPALPLRPRSVNLGLEMRMGGPPPPSSLRALASAAAPGGRTGAPTGSILTGSPRYPTPRFEPAPPGIDPLTLAVHRPACGPEAQRIANTIVTDLRSFMHAYEGGELRPTSPRNFLVVPHRGAGGLATWYELRGPSSSLGPNDDAERSVACFYIVAYRNVEARDRGIVVDTPVVGYSSALGLFYVQPIELRQGGGSLKR